MLGIGFHPDGAAGLFAAPMQEFAGRFTPLDDISMQLFKDLDRAMAAVRPIAAIEAALLTACHLRKPPDLIVSEAVREMTDQKGTTEVGRLADQFGLSIRQLERRFLAAVGLSPKVFCRIQRFNNVFRVISQAPFNWVETAIACGYYDQAHLIRDWRELSGSAPSILLAEDTDLARHFYQRFGMSHLSNTKARRAV